MSNKGGIIVGNYVNGAAKRYASQNELRNFMPNLVTKFISHGENMGALRGFWDTNTLWVRTLLNDVRKK